MVINILQEVNLLKKVLLLFRKKGEKKGFIGYGLFTVADLEQLNKQVEG